MTATEATPIYDAVARDHGWNPRYPELIALGLPRNADDGVGVTTAGVTPPSSAPFKKPVRRRPPRKLP
jgi:hypothetical protein